MKEIRFSTASHLIGKKDTVGRSVFEINIRFRDKTETRYQTRAWTEKGASKNFDKEIKELTKRGIMKWV